VDDPFNPKYALEVARKLITGRGVGPVSQPRQAKRTGPAALAGRVPRGAAGPEPPLQGLRDALEGIGNFDPTNPAGLDFADPYIIDSSGRLRR
jgi:hypothetical protein